MTADAVFQQVQQRTAALNLTTVYRNLQFLTEQGILTETHLGNGKLGYEMGAGDLHHHLLCVACGAEMSIDHAELAGFYERMSAEHGFQIEMNHITFRGCCNACKSH